MLFCCSECLRIISLNCCPVRCLYSCQDYVCHLFLWIGVLWPTFHCSGKWPENRIKLNNFKIASLNLGVLCFSIWLYPPFTPHDFFLFLRDLHFVFNSSNVIVVFSTEILRLFVQNLVYLFFIYIIFQNVLSVFYHQLMGWLFYSSGPRMCCIYTVA